MGFAIHGMGFIFMAWDLHGIAIARSIRCFKKDNKMLRNSRLFW